MTADRAARALAAFEGLALGDALGMPTQSMSRAEIREDYGVITGFRDAGPRQRIAAGMPAGSITDDTEQAVLLARLLVAGGGAVDVDDFARQLLAWEADMAARGSLDLLGPSTKAALQRLSDGVPASEAGRFGTTNGAAMRITPVGIAHPVDDLTAFVDAVAATSEPTHNTSLGIASAAAIGAAVSAGIDGAAPAEAIEVAIAAAEEGARRGHWAAGGEIAPRLRWAVPYVAELPAAKRADAVAEVVGTSVASQESVVAALALVACSDDPWSTLCLAVGLGGDTDTVAAMAGAVLGATHGGAVWPEAERAQLRRVNDLDLAPLVRELLALRG
ncbi:ADP-ribosylglycohydrolase family protein [Leifsonia sp. F6_8S_P_1B]|uniref:ADP-ribosylglycohydrolase family protein n=1 Tax=Leifsonia williamsii TaxID=3035919 RepID=A0ABT8K8S8_9MICO|nr:ADP-ribosylglycohydrolase family protein [Leifsonia williamsii]MDN4613866.1 ADP-ribosylglycohydrolase family protein [Leifsonia williamsii]